MDTSHSSMEVATTGTAATAAEPAGPLPARNGELKSEQKSEQKSEEAPLPLVRHTRRCNGRELCNCMLRVESALFHKNLAEKTKKRRVALEVENQLHAADAKEAKAVERLEEKPREGEAKPLRTSARMANRARKLLEEEQMKEAELHVDNKHKVRKKKKAAKSRGAVKRFGYVPVTKLCEFDHDTKVYILSFLTPAELAMVSMTNHDWKIEADMTAQLCATELVKLAAEGDRPIFQYQRKDGELWLRSMHLHMNAVYKLFVYYTGYKTGDMRKQFAHWAFGVVEFDPNQPHQTILPNTWKFRGHEPWITLRNNGKHGEWHLRKQYKPDKASQRFIADVKDWAFTLRPGSFLSIAYQNAGSTEPAWWEAQVWYVWRQEGRHKPAIAYDAETDTQYEIEPENLVEHFQRNPLHVVDVTTPPRRLCGACASNKKSFKYCHVEKGHPML